MKKYVQGLLSVDSHDSIVRVLQSWRLSIVGAIIGSLAATAVYAIFPPPYRARAIVVVDQNLEEAWEFGSGQLFYFLGRETRKLQELAWSDDTLQLVADQVGDVSIKELREQILQLSQPEDGGWYFFANSMDADRAELIASTWAQVFYQQTYQAIEISAELETMRREINEVLARSPDLSENDVRKLIDKISPALYETKGISYYIELNLAQIEDLNVRRSVPLWGYLLSGSIMGACGLALAALIVLRAEEKDAFLVE